jgi:ABC-type glycerol-3-phosphate transport system permease component
MFAYVCRSIASAYIPGAVLVQTNSCTRFQRVVVSPAPGVQAGVTISVIPCVLIYLLLQRYYVSGLLSGAVK